MTLAVGELTGLEFYCSHTVTLTFKWLGWYLNFSMWFMKSVLFEPKKIVIK
jgi:hypothetical protein